MELLDRKDAGQMLPVDVVFHPSWWNAHAGIVFDEDYFYHPLKRVESERKMARVLKEKFGSHGLGEGHDQDLPLIGAIHIAAGYLLSEMLGCEVRYNADAPPDVLPAGKSLADIDPEEAFRSKAFKKLEKLRDELKAKYGYVVGDINWSGILNLALDLRGQELFIEMCDSPESVADGLNRIAAVIEDFVDWVQDQTGSSSISVNRIVRHFQQAVFLHSECSNTMVSAEDYERFVLPIDIRWSRSRRPFGIHHCGKDPHRFADSYAKIDHLDFLDLGWGGEVDQVRKSLPNTFLDIRLDPVNMREWTPDTIGATIRSLASKSQDPYLTGVSCVNMDKDVSDENVDALFSTVAELRSEFLQRANDG